MIRSLSRPTAEPENFFELRISGKTDLLLATPLAACFQ
jgi:hypothetical protein